MTMINLNEQLEDGNKATSDNAKIMNHFGIIKQLEKFKEETEELLAAIYNVYNTASSVQYEDCNTEELIELVRSDFNFKDEVADVLVLIDQFIRKLGISTDVKTIRNYKILRTIDKFGI